MKMTRSLTCLSLVSVLLAGCATQPMGPTAAVMPAPGKPFAAFQDDQAICKDYARAQTGGQAQAANNNAVGGAVLGTLLGAGLGAAIGGGHGAAIGAASGAVVGTGYGAANSQGAQYDIQRQYNIAYEQCMSSKGNQIAGRPVYRVAPQPYYAPPGYGYAPPAPQPYYPPPPPPRY